MAKLEEANALTQRKLDLLMAHLAGPAGKAGGANRAAQAQPGNGPRSPRGEAGAVVPALLGPSSPDGRIASSPQMSTPTFSAASPPTLPSRPAPIDIDPASVAVSEVGASIGASDRAQLPVVRPRPGRDTLNESPSPSDDTQQRVNELSTRYAYRTDIDTPERRRLERVSRAREAQKLDRLDT
jgi:hypothetical protein